MITAILRLPEAAKAFVQVTIYRVLVPTCRAVLEALFCSRHGVLPHLYTRITVGESDDFEKWLEHEFETPAAAPLQSAVNDGRLSPDDWHHLIRFAAAQDVRTPARLLDSMQRWETKLPPLLDEVVRESVQRIEHAKKTGAILLPTPNDNDSLPLRVSTETYPNQEPGALKAELFAGRDLWLFSMKHALTSTIDTLLQHKWSIVTRLKASHGLQATSRSSD
ncbi:MAG: hypothetical protein WKF37_11055 [Bryobacteraceae bacterium]